MANNGDREESRFAVCWRNDGAPWIVNGNLFTASSDWFRTGDGGQIKNDERGINIKRRSGCHNAKEWSSFSQIIS